MFIHVFGKGWGITTTFRILDLFYIVIAGIHAYSRIAVFDLLNGLLCLELKFCKMIIISGILQLDDHFFEFLYSLVMR
jgi:glutamine cyclotransferase